MYLNMQRIVVTVCLLTTVFIIIVGLLSKQNVRRFVIKFLDSSASDTSADNVVPVTNFITEVCRKYLPNVTETVGYSPHTMLLTSHRQKLIYCRIPKAACTSWKTVLGRYNGFPNDKYVHSKDLFNYVPRYDKMPLSERRKIYPSYYKFMFVRHPFTRLFSAFHDKLLHTDKWVRGEYLPIVRQLQTRYRLHGNSTAEATFSEFVRYIVDQTSRGAEVNRHWIPMSELCQPCHFHYDFIGRYENLERDAAHVLEVLGVDEPFPVTHVHNSSELLSTAMSQLSADELRQLTDVYRMDFELFGYLPDVY